MTRMRLCAAGSLSSRHIQTRSRSRWEATQDHIAPRPSIVQLLREILQDLPGYMLVIDGIDECLATKNQAGSVVRFLEDIDQVATARTRILVVSRNEAGIRQTLRSSHRYALSEYKISPEDVQADTTAYSRDIVNRKLPNKSENVRTTISKNMTMRRSVPLAQDAGGVSEGMEE